MPDWLELEHAEDAEDGADRPTADGVELTAEITLLPRPADAGDAPDERDEPDARATTATRESPEPEPAAADDTAPDDEVEPDDEADQVTTELDLRSGERRPAPE